MKLKKVLAAALSASMLLGSLGTGFISYAEEDTVSLNFYVHSDNESIAEMQVEEYMEANPNVEINLSVIPNDDYDDKIKVLLAGGEDVDVFWDRDPSDLIQMAQEGVVLALDDMMAENDVDMSDYGDLASSFQLDGSTYGLPTTKSCWLLWYNKDLFDEAGLEYPLDLTWDEYADLCAELTTDDRMGGILINWILNIGSLAAGEYLTDDELSLTKDYVELLNRMYNEDESNVSLEEMSGSYDVYSDFADGNTYMMINGDWCFNLFPDYDPDFEWCAAPLPHYDDIEVNASIGSASCYCINAKTENPEAAFDFIKFCNYSDEGAVIEARHASVAAYPSDEALEVYNENVNVPGTEYVFAADIYLENGPETYYNELKDAYSTEISDYLVGNCSLEEAFDNFEARREEISNK